MHFISHTIRVMIMNINDKRMNNKNENVNLKINCSLYLPPSSER